MSLQVVVRGTGFQDTGTLSSMVAAGCGDAALCPGRYQPAQFINATAITTTIQPLPSSPSIPTPHLGALELSLNSQQYSTNGIRFLHISPLHVVRLVPSTGPAFGGTLVTLMGHTFIRPVVNHTGLARFGINQVPSGALFSKTGTMEGSFGSEYEVGYYISVSPPSQHPLALDPLAVAAQLSFNSQQWSSTGVTFAYYASPVVLSHISPVCGPISGGTSVTLHGKNFTNTKEITCRFGYQRTGYFFRHSVVSGTWLDKERIICVSPDTQVEYQWAFQKSEQLTWREVEVSDVRGPAEHMGATRRAQAGPGLSVVGRESKRECSLVWLLGVLYVH